MKGECTSTENALTETPASEKEAGASWRIRRRQSQHCCQRHHRDWELARTACGSDTMLDCLRPILVSCHLVCCKLNICLGRTNANGDRNGVNPCISLWENAGNMFAHRPPRTRRRKGVCEGGTWYNMICKSGAQHHVRQKSRDVDPWLFRIVSRRTKLNPG